MDDNYTRGAILWESPAGLPAAVRIAIAGDFLPAGRLVQPNSNWLEAARSIGGLTADVDIGIANLEAVLDAEDLTPRVLAGLGDIVSAEASALGFLDALGFRVVGMANNHTCDFSTPGVERTCRSVRERKMVPLGVGRTLAQLPEVFVWNGPGDIRVGFWAAAKASFDVPTVAKPGVEPATVARASRAAAELHRRDANFRIALIHCGVMRTNRPDPEDVSLLDSIAACGFNVVAGSHSHRISGCKKICASAQKQSPSFCFYGLGSLVSGYTSSPLEREGLIVVAALNSHGELIRLEARPILLEDSGFAVIPVASIGATILERFQSLSNEIAAGSYARLFYRDVSQNLIRFYLRDARAAFRHAGVRGLARKATRLRMSHIRRLVHKVMD